jgi:zinc protease
MRLIFAALILFIALPAQAAEKVLNIQEITSPGGIKAWLVEDHSLPIISMQFSFNNLGTALDPEDKQGLARMVSNTMDEGAGPLDSQAFQKELQDLVSAVHFNAGRDNFSGELKTLKKNSDRTFELLRLAVNEPRFDAEPIERMRESNKARIRSSLTDPDWMAARIQNDVVYAGHPYAKNSGGTLSGLDKITADDLRNFTKAFSKDRLLIAVAGDITPQDLAAKIDAVFGKLPATSAVSGVTDVDIQNQGKLFVYRQDIPQAVVELLQPGIARTDPDYQTAQVMNYILGSSGFGSRLTKQIREDRGLTYGIYSYLMNYDHANGLSVSTSTKNESVVEMLSLIKQEWDKMKAEPITATELKNAKSYLIGSLPLSLTSTESIASMVHGIQLDGLPIDYLEQREDKIRKTTIEDVSAMSKRLLDFDKFVTVIVGQPEGRLDHAQEVKALPNVE